MPLISAAAVYRPVSFTALLALACVVGLSPLMAQAEAEGLQFARQLIEDIGALAYVEQVDARTESVRNHEVGLGALQKVRGAWRLDRSERISGDLERHTWRVVDGYSSQELLQVVTERLEQADSLSLLFSCDARACGQSVQWANRMFQQRVLYGTEVSQRYRVYGFGADDGAGRVARLLLYSSARTTDRQYFHLELIEGKLEASPL